MRDPGAHEVKDRGSRQHPRLAAACCAGDRRTRRALGRALSSCKFQLWSKLVNEFLCRIQGTYASPSTKFAHGLVHPEKWTWRAFPSITLTQTGQRRFVGGYALSPKEEGRAGPEAPGSESETWRCHRLWAWASPFSLGLSLLLCEMGCTISCG